MNAQQNKDDRCRHSAKEAAAYRDSLFIFLREMSYFYKRWLSIILRISAGALRTPAPDLASEPACQ